MAFRYSLFLIIITLISSCGKPEIPKDDVLLRYEDKELLLADVIEQIPDGISKSDSAALFKKIVDDWVRDNVLSEFAAKHLYDVRAIERRVSDYRNALIVQEYLSRMMESQTPKVDEKRVKDYYDAHRNDFKLEVPLIKGVFLKINSDSKGKDEIKNLITSDSADKIDELEKKWLDRSLEYNYFRDKWVDWETVARLIPHRFGDAETFLKDNNYFETQYGDCSYYLYIAEVLNQGEEQPYEYAKGWILNLLTQGNLADYERALVKSLVNKSINEKKLETIGYDPLTQEISIQNEK